MRARDSLLLLGAAVMACASSLPVERRDYVLAHPHGWVEVAVDDRAVPLVPEASGEEAGATKWVKPEICFLSVRLDGEEFVDSTQVFPQGERAPYRADSGVRFPAPVGMPVLKVRWSGCRVSGEKARTVETEIFVAVERDRLTRVAFDGEQLATSAPAPDPVLSLEDVYEAITGQRTKPR